MKLMSGKNLIIGFIVLFSALVLLSAIASRNSFHSFQWNPGGDGWGPAFVIALLLMILGLISPIIFLIMFINRKPPIKK